MPWRVAHGRTGADQEHEHAAGVTCESVLSQKVLVLNGQSLQSWCDGHVCMRGAGQR
jgi:hypothetical protein